MTFEGGGGGVGSPCPPSRSAHVFNAILNIKIILNGKKICSFNYVVSRLRILVNTVGNSCTALHYDMASF